MKPLGNCRHTGGEHTKPHSKTPFCDHWEAPKPVPPADLWARIAAAAEEVQISGKVPEGAFTLKEFRERLNLTDPAARNRLTKLKKAGRIEFIVRLGAIPYYKFVG